MWESGFFCNHASSNKLASNSMAATLDKILGSMEGTKRTTELTRKSIRFLVNSQVAINAMQSVNIKSRCVPTCTKATNRLSRDGLRPFRAFKCCLKQWTIEEQLSFWNSSNVECTTKILLPRIVEKPNFYLYFAKVSLAFLWVYLRGFKLWDMIAKRR